jgi:hypothetical protein
MPLLQVAAAMANPAPALPAPVISANLLPDMTKLPPPPEPVSGSYPRGRRVGFQLVNCTPEVQSICTYDQHDAVCVFSNTSYMLQPKSAVNCLASANKDPFDIQYSVNSDPVQRARQSVRLFLIQVPRPVVFSPMVVVVVMMMMMMMMMFSALVLDVMCLFFPSLSSLEVACVPFTMGANGPTKIQPSLEK